MDARTLPQPIRADCVWKGSEFDLEGRAFWALSAEDVQEIGTAVRNAMARPDFDFLIITPETFPLPSVGPRLKEVRREISEGSGVALMRGLQQGGFSADELSVALVGLGSHIGPLLAQSHRGEVLGSVIDASDVEGQWRAYHMGGAQNFHTDGTPCDVQALMCLRPAKAGGASRIASAAAVHNTLLEQRPDLIEVLYGDFLARRADGDVTQTGGAKRVSVFAQDDGRFTCLYTSGEFRRAVTAGDAKLTPLQAEAFEEIQRLASSPEYYLDMMLREGDIQFLNNRTILHGRLAYEDYEDFAERRYMLRLSIQMPDWPPRPARQVTASVEDARAWLATREPGSDLPSAYLAALAQHGAARAGAPAQM